MSAVMCSDFTQLATNGVKLNPPETGSIPSIEKRLVHANSM